MCGWITKARAGACLYQVITGGDQGEILRKDGKECITPFDAIPFATTTPVPITHRFFGRSIADLVMPVQREKTALKRGALDNLYLHNNPRVEVAESMAGPNTLDDLLVSRPGGVVRTKTAGRAELAGGAGYHHLDLSDAAISRRRAGNPHRRQPSRPRASTPTRCRTSRPPRWRRCSRASQMRMKLIARIMAEGVRDIFALLHGTIRKHGQQQQTVRLRNAWVNVDPRGWKTRDDMTINVGLGAGGKAQQFAQTMAIANVQKEMLAGGKANLVGDLQLYNTAAELTRIMGHKNPDKFFNDPSAVNPQTGQLLHPPPAPPAPPPDPKLLAAQARAQTEQAVAAHKAQIEQQQAQNAAIHLQVKTQAEIELAKIKADLDAKLQILDAHIDGRTTAFFRAGRAKSEGRPPLCPGSGAARQIFDGGPPRLTMRLFRSITSLTLTVFRWCRSSTIRLALSSRHRLSPWRPTPRGFAEKR